MNKRKQSHPSRSQKSKGSAGGARHHAMGGSGKQRNSDSFTPFHSSVNRIPLPRPAVLDEVEAGALSQELFGDGRAVGHDHLTADRWSGTFDIEMTVHTPLVCGVQEKLDGDGGPTTVRVQEHDGKVFISPTMVKGMISRAYEVLTVSRFRVFGEHDKPLTYRVDPAAANRLILARVVRSGGELKLKVSKESGSSVRFRIPDSEEVARQHGVDLLEIRDLLQPDEKAQRVKVKGGYVVGVASATDVKENSEDIKFGYVMRVAAPGATSEDLMSDQSKDSGTTDDKETRKKYEHFLVNLDSSKADLLPLTTEHIDKYLLVLDSYIDEHDARKPKSDDSAEMRRWARSLNRAAWLRKENPNRGLEAGDLVFVVPRGTKKDRFSQFDIVPTMVGRRAYRHSPRFLAERQNVLPLAGADQASAADRLFGYVVDSPSGNAKGGDVAYRGRISVGPVDTSIVEVKKLDSGANLEGHLLPPLLSPKVSSARRFITDKDGRTPMKSGSQGEKDSIFLPRSEYFTEGQFLGTAAYPVHRSLRNGDFLPKAKEENKNKKIQLFVKSYIKPESTMRCQIAVENVSSEELGLLLWLLTPENLVPAKEKAANTQIKCGYLRMGLGKPFGLGAIEVRFVPGSLRVTKGSVVADKYAALSGVLGLNDEVVAEDTFLREIPHDFTQRPWVEAFQRAASGYSSGRVRYMTLEENKRNNQTNSKTGKPEKGRGISPRDLWGDGAEEPIRIPKNDQNGS